MDAALELMADRSFDQITMVEIGKQAGISYGSITHHFGSKQGLLLAIFDDSQDRLTNMLAELGGAPTTNDRALDILADWFGTTSPAAPMMLVESLRDPVVGHVLRNSRQDVIDVVAAYLGGPTAELEAQGLTGLADGLILLSRLLPDRVDFTAAWRAIMRLVLLGVAADGRLNGD
jgi:AcrR family transcriptional regulator